MIPFIRKLAPTVIADPPGYRVGRRYFPAVTRLSQGQIYSSATYRHQRTDGMNAVADYSATFMPASGTQVYTPVNSSVQPVNHYQYHFWTNQGWYWKTMRPMMDRTDDVPAVFNQMGKQLPGQPMMMTPQPRFTSVINAPRYNTVPAGLTPTQGQISDADKPSATSVVGRTAMQRRRFFNSAPFVAKGPQFHG